jgi:hypothetical protein
VHKEEKKRKEGEREREEKKKETECRILKLGNGCLNKKLT